MNPVELIIGSVNFTGYLHVVARKVQLNGNTGPIFWDTYINAPFTNYDLVIPHLDPDNYYITFYEAVNTSDLGEFRSEGVINAKVNGLTYEMKFYTVGSLPVGVTLDFNGGDDTEDALLTDEYLKNKTVVTVYKEGLRPLEPVNEYTHDKTAGTISWFNGMKFGEEEKIPVFLSYINGQIAKPGKSLYTNTITITDETFLLDAVTHKDNRLRLKSATNKQVITLPALDEFEDGEGFYFDNSIGGGAIQPRLLFTGGDLLKFNGFQGPTVSAFFNMNEFWINRGDKFRIIRFTDYGDEIPFWELDAGNHSNAEVGYRMPSGYRDHGNWFPENGDLMDGDIYPGLFWFITYKLNSAQRFQTNFVDLSDAAYKALVVSISKQGQFGIHTSERRFRMPCTEGLMDKGLLDFDTPGADTTRLYDNVGGFQPTKVGPHFHLEERTVSDIPPDGTPGKLQYESNRFQSGSERGLWRKFINGQINNKLSDTAGSGDKTTVDNNGVIFLRHI
jgi:hypothetical protein